MESSCVELSGIGLGGGTLGGGVRLELGNWEMVFGVRGRRV